MMKSWLRQLHLLFHKYGPWFMDCLCNEIFHGGVWCMPAALLFPIKTDEAWSSRSMDLPMNIVTIPFRRFTITMGLFPQLSPKEIIFLSQWKRYHKYQIFCSVSIVICVTCVSYTKYWNHISDVFFDSSKSMKIIAFKRKQ